MTGFPEVHGSAVHGYLVVYCDFDGQTIRGLYSRESATALMKRLRQVPPVPAWPSPIPSQNPDESEDDFTDRMGEWDEVRLGSWRAHVVALGFTPADVDSFEWVCGRRGPDGWCVMEVGPDLAQCCCADLGVAAAGRVRT